MREQRAAGRLARGGLRAASTPRRALRDRAKVAPPLLLARLRGRAGPGRGEGRGGTARTAAPGSGAAPLPGFAADLGLPESPASPPVGPAQAASAGSTRCGSDVRSKFALLTLSHSRPRGGASAPPCAAGEARGGCAARVPVPDAALRLLASRVERA